MAKSFEKRFEYGLFIFIVVCTVVTGAFMQNGLAAEKVSPQRGYQAPNFTLADLKGNNIELKQVIKGNKVTLVNFWGIWCPYCVQEIPELVKFYHQYHSRKVEILGVNVGDAPGTVPSFVQKNQMVFPILIDKSNSINELYQVSGFPTTFIIDRQGKIRDIIVGATNLETLAAKVEGVLKEK
jgi:peroxiredoxin